MSLADESENIVDYTGFCLNDLCPICFENENIDFIVLNCNHEYCFECIEKWLLKSSSCPMCRKHIECYFFKETKEKVNCFPEPQLQVYVETSVYAPLFVTMSRVFLIFFLVPIVMTRVFLEFLPFFVQCVFFTSLLFFLGSSCVMVFI